MNARREAVPNVLVAARNLWRSFGSDDAKVDALRGVDLEVRSGEFVAVMGPSGSGKSVLLHTIGGLDAPTSGEVVVGGERLSDLNDDELTLLRRRKIGFIFQAFNLVGVLTAVENVALPLVMDGVPEDAAEARAREELERVHLNGRGEHLPSALSGGEQQRVAIARALVTRPLVVLADEPTGNLDSAHGDEIMRILRTLADERCRTILMVTHDVRDAAMADRIVNLCDGRVAAEESR